MDRCLPRVDFDLPGYGDEDPNRSGDDPAESRGQGGAAPTEDEDAAATREEPFDHVVDSIGRTYARDQHGYRVTPGRRRPPGIPPNIWKGLSKKDNIELSRK